MSALEHSYLPFSNLNSTPPKTGFPPLSRVRSTFLPREETAGRLSSKQLTPGFPEQRLVIEPYSTLDKMQFHYRVSPSIEFAKYPFIHLGGDPH